MGLIILADCERLQSGTDAQRIRYGRATNTPRIRSELIADAQQIRREKQCFIRLQENTK